ncbi:hypothetical protein IWX49DRAFT_422961 [Phyllosticta citricarpa]
MPSPTSGLISKPFAPAPAHVPTICLVSCPSCHPACKVLSAALTMIESAQAKRPLVPYSTLAFAEILLCAQFLIFEFSRWPTGTHDLNVEPLRSEMHSDNQHLGSHCLIQTFRRHHRPPELVPSKSTAMRSCCGALEGRLSQSGSMRKMTGRRLLRWRRSSCSSPPGKVCCWPALIWKTCIRGLEFATCSHTTRWTRSRRVWSKLFEKPPSHIVFGAHVRKSFRSRVEEIVHTQGYLSTSVSTSKFKSFDSSAVLLLELWQRSSCLHPCPVL